MSIKIIHTTLLDEESYKNIQKNGLILPSDFNKHQKIKQYKLKQYFQSGSNINKKLIDKINVIFDKVKPEDIPIQRQNTIYSFLFENEQFDLHTYKKTNISVIEIKNYEGAYIGDLSMSGLMWCLNDLKIHPKTNPFLGFKAKRKLKQLAKEYWENEVIPIEEFFKYFEYAPHEESSYNWNNTLSWKECEKRNITRCMSLPELLFNRPIPASDIKFLRYKKLKF